MFNTDEKDIPESAKLPRGKTCSDCFWFYKCEWLVAVDPKNRWCDWTPSRFTNADNQGQQQTTTDESQEIDA